jgi:hypothetical protein
MCLVSVFSLPVVDFLDQDYPNKSVATQIPHNTWLASTHPAQTIAWNSVILPQQWTRGKNK